jgi:hypothetical protein
MARTLSHAFVRPVWFPSPQPPGRFAANADALPIFYHGLEWLSGQRYFFLDRVPGGANLGEPFPTQVADPYVASLHGHVKVWRLAKVEGGRLFAQWPTLGHYPDVTAAVAQDVTLRQFVAFLRSLQHIAWPTCPAASS